MYPTNDWLPNVPVAVKVPVPVADVPVVPIDLDEMPTNLLRQSSFSADTGGSGRGSSPEVEDTTELLELEDEDELLELEDEDELLVLDDADEALLALDADEALLLALDADEALLLALDADEALLLALDADEALLALEAEELTELTELLEALDETDEALLAAEEDDPDEDAIYPAVAAAIAAWAPGLDKVGSGFTEATNDVSAACCAAGTKRWITEPN